MAMDDAPVVTVAGGWAVIEPYSMTVVKYWPRVSVVHGLLVFWYTAPVDPAATAEVPAVFAVPVPGG